MFYSGEKIENIENNEQLHTEDENTNNPKNNYTLLKYLNLTKSK